MKYCVKQRSKRPQLSLSEVDLCSGRKERAEIQKQIPLSRSSNFAMRSLVQARHETLLLTSALRILCSHPVEQQGHLIKVSLEP
eukprot:2959-Heterococcus_DN1.PRE.3